MASSTGACRPTETTWVPLRSMIWLTLRIALLLERLDLS
jgi:hypothetical protein